MSISKDKIVTSSVPTADPSKAVAGTNDSASPTPAQPKPAEVVKTFRGIVREDR